MYIQDRCRNKTEFGLRVASLFRKVYMEKFYEKTLSSEIVFRGKIFDIKHDEVELSNGAHSFRDIILHPGGVVIVAQKGEKVLLVRQYRYAVSQAMYELPAGKLEYGEDPFEAAKRELHEETGYEAEDWESLGFIHTTAGICNEKLYLFKAKVSDFVGQNPDENEIIDYFEFDKTEVFDMIKRGEINDAKTLCGLMRAFKL